jgi:hypothetical protein
VQLAPVRDNRKLLANLADGYPNPYTHAYKYYEVRVAATVLEKHEACAELVVIVRPLRESIDKCKNKRYKQKNKQHQITLAGHQYGEIESNWDFDSNAMPNEDA